MSALFAFRRTGLLAALALGALLGACRIELDHGPGLDREVRLAYGRQVYLDDANLTLAFTEVVGESRCPTGAQCAWAGEATIAITASRSGAATVRRELVLPSADRHRATYLDLEIILAKLEPHPSVGHAPAKAEYVATFIVTRR